MRRALIQRGLERPGVAFYELALEEDPGGSRMRPRKPTSGPGARHSEACVRICRSRDWNRRMTPETDPAILPFVGKGAASRLVPGCRRIQLPVACACRSKPHRPGDHAPEHSGDEAPDRDESGAVEPPSDRERHHHTRCQQ